MRELSHRSKNLLAVVMAMAKQTARISPSIDRFLEQFSGRVEGLAKSHDLLVNEDWTGALLADLVNQQLQTFVGGDGRRIEARGPSIFVNPDAAQTIGLALHELGTNASKYGALSRSSGKVLIDWKIEALNGVPRFHMTWREHGGPSVRAPEQSGFGRTLIERVTAEKLNGTAELAFPPDGVTWTLDAPVDQVLAAGGRKQ
jgi:two-component sensor histidine kinase